MCADFPAASGYIMVFLNDAFTAFNGIYMKKAAVTVSYVIFSTNMYDPLLLNSD